MYFLDMIPPADPSSSFQFTAADRAGGAVSTVARVEKRLLLSQPQN